MRSDRLFVFTLILVGCTKGARAPARDRTVVDGVGQEVGLRKEVRRVVSLAPSTTETLFALGAGGVVVGIDRYSNWPAEADRLAKVGADMDPSLERIAGLKPDVVFMATSANSKATADALGRMGIPVFVSRVDHLSELYADIEKIAFVVGKESEGKRLGSALRARIEAMQKRTSGQKPVPTLLVVWPKPLVVAGAGSHLHELITAAGGQNIAADSPAAFPTYSTERLLVRAPEVIIVGTHVDDRGPPPLESLQALKSVPAIANHRMHVVDGDLLFRTGPRLAEGMDKLFELLHPAVGDSVKP